MFEYLVLGVATAYALFRSFSRNDRSGDDSHLPRLPPSYESPQSPVHQLDELPIDQRCLGCNHYLYPTDASQGGYISTEAHALLRARAKQEAELRNQCYQQSKEAYQRHDYARAKVLSSLGKRHGLEVKSLNAEAAAVVFKGRPVVISWAKPTKSCPVNNKNKSPCDVDLHDLHVKEAFAYSARAIAAARQRHDPEIRLIVGQGTHSDGGIPRLKPAVLKYLRKCDIHVEVHPRNPGVLVVQLGNK